MKVDPIKFETLVKWYARFNQYFAIENFIIHAAGDPSRISNGVISNYSEIDVLAIKMPFSREVTGELEIENDARLLPVRAPKIDILIGECKTGRNTLNKIWTQQNLTAISYVLRFTGVFSTEDEIYLAAKELLAVYQFEDPLVRVRLVLFSVTRDQSSPELTRPLNITLDDILDFLLFIRGGCWVDTNIGLRSIHPQWPKLVNDIFQIGNDANSTTLDKKKQAMALMI